MLLEKNNLQCFIGTLGTVAEYSKNFYIYTDLVIQTLERLHTIGFDSLIDCFITRKSYMYFQLTNFIENQTLFIETQRGIEQMNENTDLYRNYKLYEKEILQYINACD